MPDDTVNLDERPELTDADVLREVGMDEAAEILEETLGGWF